MTRKTWISPMKGRYTQVYNGEWWAVPKELDLQCCDCGLVHAVYFRIRCEGKKPLLEMRMDRSERATAQVRRYRRRKR